jgi:HlyD family secretion protein
MKLSNRFEKLKNLFQRKNWWIGALLVLVLGAAAWLVVSRVNAAAAAKAAEEETPIQTATVRRGDLRVSITGAGTLAAKRIVDLSFSTMGTVSEVFIKEGDEVKSGQELAKLGNLQSLEASVASAKASLLEAKKDLKDLQENADVSLAQSYADYVTARADFEDADYAMQKTAYARCSQDVNTRNAESVTRARDSLNSKLPGSAEWTEAKSVYDTAVANYDYCIAYTDDEKEEYTSRLELARTKRDLAEMKYTSLKDSSGIDPDELALAEARVNDAETRLEKLQNDLDGTTLTAPMDGVVTYLAAEAGSIVGTGTYITISDLSDLVVDVQIDQADLQDFVKGSSAEAVFDALPDDVFTGTLVQIDPELTSDFGSTSASGQVELAKDAVAALAQYPLGLSATVEVIRDEVKDVLLVPQEALRDLGDGEYAVFVIEDDGVLRLHTVEVGLKDITSAEIKSGLSEGQKVSTGLVQTGS